MNMIMNCLLDKKNYITYELVIKLNMFQNSKNMCLVTSGGIVFQTNWLVKAFSGKAYIRTSGMDSVF